MCARACVCDRMCEAREYNVYYILLNVYDHRDGYNTVCKRLPTPPPPPPPRISYNIIYNIIIVPAAISRGPQLRARTCPRVEPRRRSD